MIINHKTEEAGVGQQQNQGSHIMSNGKIRTRYIFFGPRLLNVVLCLHPVL